MAPEGSQQLREQDPAPARRCGTEGRTGHQGREGGNRDGKEDGKEDECRDEHEGRDEGENGSGNGIENEDEARGEVGEEREPRILRTGNRGGSEDAKRQVTPKITSNHSRKTQRPSETSHHAEDLSPGTGGEGQNRGGRTRSGEAQESSQEL